MAWQIAGNAPGKSSSWCAGRTGVSLSIGLRDREERYLHTHPSQCYSVVQKRNHKGDQVCYSQVLRHMAWTKRLGEWDRSSRSCNMGLLCLDSSFSLQCLSWSSISLSSPPELGLLPCQSSPPNAWPRASCHVYEGWLLSLRTLQRAKSKFLSHNHAGGPCTNRSPLTFFYLKLSLCSILQSSLTESNIKKVSLATKFVSVTSSPLKRDNWFDIQHKQEVLKLDELSQCPLLSFWSLYFFSKQQSPYSYWPDVPQTTAVDRTALICCLLIQRPHYMWIFLVRDYTWNPFHAFNMD